MAIARIHDEAELETALREPLAVLYKHSTRCGISFRAMREVEKFAEQTPEVPVYLVDVVADRALSDAVAKRFSIPHQSPQAIVVEGGQAIWHDSHFKVSVRELKEAVGA